MSEEIKHTPGPWRGGHPTEHGTFNPDHIETQDGSGVCQVFRIPMHSELSEITDGDGAERWAEGIANARLIAAAPDLLAACVEFVRKVDAGKARSTRSYKQMKAAIAKAKGTP